MIIGILHLTDLHLKQTENPVADRVDKIITAIRLDLNEIETVFVVSSGDNVDKGIKESYIAVKKFFEILREKLLEIVNIRSVEFIIVPGNHDCDFNYDSQLRRNAIDSVSYESICEDDSVIDICTDVQEPFWEFYQTYCKLPDSKLFYQIVNVIEDVTICFNCFNTSWMSKKDEEPGIFFPTRRFYNKEDIIQGNINISVLHHPIYWFSSSGELNNRKEFQQFLEENSSIILAGHEHEFDHKKNIDLWSEKETTYFSGQIFQNISGDNSGFQLITIDIEKKSGVVKPFQWTDNIYASKDSKDFAINGERYGHKRFKHRTDYLHDLDKLRIPISVEGNSDIRLSDFYVFPDLESPELNTKDIESFYDSEDLITEIDFTTCLIEGENQSGKTSLIAMMYLRFVEADKYPLLIECSEIKNPNIDSILKSAFDKQYANYDTVDYDRFIQHDRIQKVVLLDNLQELRFNPKTIKHIIQELEARFGKVIVLTNILYGLVSKVEAEFEELKTFNLRPLGYKKRNKLIENYHRLSLSPHTGTNEVLLSRTKESFNKVETVLGDKLMPSYPVFVLSILQALVYSKPTNYEQTSYGYCYQSLIHIALYKKAKIENEYIDTYFNFLAEFALHLYETKKGYFKSEDLETFFESYKKTYHVGFNFEPLKNSLLDSQLITVLDDTWRFSYRYIYYFLIARRIAELVGTEDGKNAIRYLCANLHEEQNAKILVFIAHHTKDEFLIDEATFTAMIPFENIPPITLDKHGHYYDLIKDIVKDISSDVIEASSNPMESRNEILEAKDKLEREQEINSIESSKSEDGEDFNEYMMPFFQAFRALEIVGQIIKNRKGSIPVEQLVDMITELYNTAFRTISFFGKNLVESKDDFIKSIVSKIDDDDTQQRIEEKVNGFFQYISLQICLGVFGKVIYSVGQKDLRKLFESVAERIDTPAADLVTFSINSYYGNMSTGDLKRIVRKYEKNFVAMQIIKARVKSYLYQNYVDYRKRQSFASTLHMRIGTVRR